MPIDGTPRYTTIALGELTAKFTGPSVLLTAKAAFVDRNAGSTNGWTIGEGSIWSPGTLALIAQLREAMEIDLATRHFTDYASNVRAFPSNADPQPPGGLSEFLREEADPA